MSVMAEIFSNVCGTFLIYLAWSTDFTHGIYLLGFKVVFVLTIIVTLTTV